MYDKIIVLLMQKFSISGLTFPLILVFVHFLAHLFFVTYSKLVKDKSILTEGVY